MSAGLSDISLIRNLISIVFQVFFIVLLFRKDFRFSIKLSIGIMAAWYTITIASHFLWSDSRLYTAFIAMGDYLVFLPLFKWNRLNCWNCSVLFMSFLSIIASVFLGVFSGIAALISGSGKWYVSAEGSLSMNIISCVSAILAACVSFLIIRKLKPYVIRFEAPEKWILFVTVIVIPTIGAMAKAMIMDLAVYANDPSGTPWVIDVIRVSSIALAVMAIAIAVVRIKRREKKETENEIQRLFKDYSEIEQLKRQISEIRHELHNRIGSCDE